MIPRRFRAWLKLLPSIIFSDLNIKVRLLFCSIVGLISLLVTQPKDFDNRFSLRGPQPVPEKIILIYLSAKDLDWLEVKTEAGTSIKSIKEITEPTDNFFWNSEIWSKAVDVLNKSGINICGVSLYFGPDLNIDASQLMAFREKPNFIWAARIDSRYKLMPPAFASAVLRNIGSIELRPDSDGIHRHFNKLNSIPHLAQKLSDQTLVSPYSSTSMPIINFLGPAGSFKSYSFKDLINEKIPPSKLNGAKVIIGISDLPNHFVITPVGQMPQAEFIANILYNLNYNKGITLSPFWLGALYIFIILLLTYIIIVEYPQTAAFVFLIFLGLITVALSTSLFDVYQVWLPLEAPLATIFATFIIISSYRLAESEKYSWQAEREKHYLNYVEELKNNFLSLISHDLKNPLAKIQGITDRLLSVKDAELSPSIRSDLLSIGSISEELRRYITSILQLTKVEARNIKLTKEVCDINTIIEEVVSNLKPLANQKGIRIETDLEPLFSMEIDRTLIAEVLLNLVENAIKYSKQNSKIQIFSQEVGNDVRVEVKDNGPGIAAADLPKVFEKFYRGAQESLSASGSGLGLYLVKYFIELHGGKVFIDSKLGEGTAVGFSLPLEQPKEPYADFKSIDR